MTAPPTQAQQEQETFLQQLHGSVQQLPVCNEPRSQCGGASQADTVAF